MLSYSTLGKSEVRLGNQMFQYAFVRSMALRLGVKFYCPSWRGDLLFNLNDENEKVNEPIAITNYYQQVDHNPGFTEDALLIQDHTEIFGYFQSEKYYQDPELVRQWFSFKEEIKTEVDSMFQQFNFSNAVGIHLRFGDVFNQLKRPPMRKIYYQKALALIPKYDIILVFSDDLELSKKLLADLPGNIIYVTGNQDYQDLYLMTKCKHFICSYSTFCWWGAWLGKQEDRVIIYPKEGQYRLGYSFKAQEVCPHNWRQIPSLRGFLDDYRLVSRLEKRLPKSLFIKWFG